jgi:hypothetical protein
MKNKLIKLAGVAAAVVALAQTVQANPITGVIQMAGGVTANSANAGSVTTVTGWSSSYVTYGDGSFSVIPTFPNPASLVTMTSTPWNVNTSTPIASFWTVDGFTFKLMSSTAVANVSGASLSITLFGYVSTATDGPTAFSGNLTLQNPSGGSGPNNWTYSESISFGAVPDGGTTVLLLGAALSGLAFVKRKMTA